MPRTQPPAVGIRTLPALTKNETLIQAGVEAHEENALVRIILNERYHITAELDDPDMVRVELFTDRMDDVHEIGRVAGHSGCAFWCTLRELQQIAKGMSEAGESARHLMPTEGT